MLELASIEKQKVSRYLIFRDLRFAYTMLLSITRREQSGEAISWLTLAYLHYLSLVAYEIRKYSGPDNLIPGVGAVLRFEPSLSESRHSTKLFDDNAKTVQDLLDEFISYATNHREWYIDATAAPALIRSSTFLQNLVDDTSIHLYDGQILSTSQSIRYHVGLDMHVSGQEIRDRAEELARYLASLCRDQAAEWMHDKTFADH